MRRTLIVSAAAFLALTGANLYCALVLEPSRFRQVSRDTVTDVLDVPRVVGHRLASRGVLELRLAPDPGAAGWQVAVDGADPTPAEGRLPRISLLKGTHDYLVAPTDEAGSRPARFTVTVDYQPAETFQAAGRGDAADSCYVSRMSIPAWPAECHSLDEWCGVGLRGRDMKKAREAISEFGLPTQPTLKTVEALGCRLLGDLEAGRGIPSDAVRRASPFEKYQMAREGRGRVWCGDIAAIYHLFANAAGIRTRRVSLSGVMDGVAYSGHAVCESYIPEQDRWACVDLTARILHVADREGRVLNTVELADVLRADSLDLQARVWKPGGVEDSAYAAVCRAHRGYFNENGIIVYRLPAPRGGRIGRYLSRPNQLVVANHPVSDDFARRMTLVGLWAGSGVWLLGVVLVSLLRSRAVRSGRGAPAA